MKFSHQVRLVDSQVELISSRRNENASKSRRNHEEMIWIFPDRARSSFQHGPLAPLCCRVQLLHGGTPVRAAQPSSGRRQEWLGLFIRDGKRMNNVFWREAPNVEQVLLPHMQ